MANFGQIFTMFAAKVLAFDQTSLPKQQFAMIQDMLANEKILVKGKEEKELLNCLKRKHLVNSITMRRIRDGLVFSSSGNGQAESKNASDIMNFVNKNFALADIVTMRTEKEWIMLLPLQENLYVIKANSSLSMVELKAISKEIETILKKRLIA